MSKYTILSVDQIANMNDDELRRLITKTRNAIHNAETTNRNDLKDLQENFCYLYREREIRIARVEAHRVYLLSFSGEGSPDINV